MKLRTEMDDDNRLKLTTIGDMSHDALAAHALLQAIDEWTMAPAIKQRADELMREWTTSELSSNPR